MHWNVNNLYGRNISQKLPVDDFESKKKKKTSNFDESFIKDYDDVVIKDTYLRQMLNILRNYKKKTKKNTMMYQFHTKERRLKNVKICLQFINVEKYVLHITTLK